jgi:hypothetical protein
MRQPLVELFPSSSTLRPETNLQDEGHCPTAIASNIFYGKKPVTKTRLKLKENYRQTTKKQVEHNGENCVDAVKNDATDEQYRIRINQELSHKAKCRTSKSHVAENQRSNEKLSDQCTIDKNVNWTTEFTQPANCCVQSCVDCHPESVNNRTESCEPLNAVNCITLSRQPSVDLNNKKQFESTRPAEGDLQTCNDCRLESANNTAAVGIQPSDAGNLEPGEWSLHRQLMDLNDNYLAESTQPLESSLQTCNNSLFESADNTAAVGIQPRKLLKS